MKKRLFYLLMIVIIIASSSTIFCSCGIDTSFENAKYIYDEDTTFVVDRKQSSMLGVPFNLLLDKDSYIVLKSDGTAKMSIKLSKSLNSTLNFLLGQGIADSFRYDAYIDSMAREYVPGYDLTNAKHTFELIKKCLKLSFGGLDFSKPEIVNLFDSLQNEGIIPNNFTVPKDFTIYYEAPYYIRDVQVDIGNKYTGVFIGKHSEGGEPYMLMDLSKDQLDNKKLYLRLDMLELNVIAICENS